MDEKQIVSEETAVPMSLAKRAFMKSITASSITQARWIIVCCVALLYAHHSAACFAQEAPKPTPVGRIVTVESPISDETLGLIRRTGLELQRIAEQESRKAFLILEIQPGISEFHQVYAVADFLSGAALRDVTTVAYLPESVSGNVGIIPLACHQIVMAADAEFGDLGRGESLENDRQQVVQAIVAKRRNPRLSAPLASALMDPAVAVSKVTIENDNGETESKLVSDVELSKLLNDNVIVTEQRTIIEAGSPGLLSGREAKQEQILVSSLAESRRQVADRVGVQVDMIRELLTPDEQAHVVYIALHDEIGRAFHAFADQQIDRAVSNGAQTIIFEIDTPGGLLDVCIDLSSKILRLNESGIRTIAYIPNEAISGGAIIASACEEIYLHPDASIGDAMPISMNLVGGFEEAHPKILSVLTKHMRTLAEKTGRPAAILEGFCDPHLIVFEVTNKRTGQKWYMSEDEFHMAGDDWEQGPRVPESRESVAIFLNGQRAYELQVAAAPVNDITEFKERLGFSPDTEFQTVQRVWVDDLVFYLNNRWVTGMLFFVAIVCIYIEMATMTGFFGILAASAFGVFFWSRMLGGTATSLELTMFVIGIGFIAMEVFVIPGFGVFGVSGILMIVGSLVMASMSLSTLGLKYNVETAVVNFAPLAGSLVGVILFSIVLGKYLPKIPVLNSMVLMPPNETSSFGGESIIRPSTVSPTAALMGREGTAVSVLRPAGKARIDDRLYDVVSDGPYIQDGANIAVVLVNGNRIVVREVEQS